MGSFRAVRKLLYRVCKFNRVTMRRSALIFRVGRSELRGVPWPRKILESWVSAIIGKLLMAALSQYNLGAVQKMRLQTHPFFSVTRLRHANYNEISVPVSVTSRSSLTPLPSFASGLSGRLLTVLSLIEHPLKLSP